MDIQLTNNILNRNYKEKHELGTHHVHDDVVDLLVVSHGGQK